MGEMAQLQEEEEREKFLGGKEEISKGNSCNLSLLLALCEGRGFGGGRKKLPKCFLAARRARRRVATGVAKM